MGTSSAETKMMIGVTLRTQIVNAKGAPDELIETGCALRAHASNVGVISHVAKMFTRTIGTAVTDCRNSHEWTVSLILPASSGARTEKQEDTELIVVERKQQVAFHTMCSLSPLLSDPRLPAGTAGHYEGRPLDVFGTTS